MLFNADKITRQRYNVGHFEIITGLDIKARGCASRSRNLEHRVAAAG